MKSTLMMLGILFAMFTAGCGTEDDGDTGASGAMLVGSVESGLTPAGGMSPDDITFTVNDVPTEAELGDDQDFAVRALPTGDIHVEIAVEGIRGTLDLDAVEPGELIEVTLRIEENGLTISVVRREPPAETQVEDITPPVHDGDIVIEGHHTVYRFAPGIYRGDVIVKGHHLTLVGAPNPGCDPQGGSVLQGALRLEGHHIRVMGLSTQGPVTLPRKSHHVGLTQPACDAGTWFDGVGDDDHDDHDDDRHHRD